MYNSNKLNDPSNVQYDEKTIPVFARWFGSWQISVRRRALSSPQLTHFYDLAAPGWSQMLDRLGFPNAYETLLRKVLSDEASGVAGSSTSRSPSAPTFAFAFRPAGQGAYPVLARCEDGRSQTGIVLATKDARVARLPEQAETKERPLDLMLERRVTAVAPLKGASRNVPMFST